MVAVGENDGVLSENVSDDTYVRERMNRMKVIRITRADCEEKTR